MQYVFHQKLNIIFILLQANVAIENGSGIVCCFLSCFNFLFCPFLVLCVAFWSWKLQFQRYLQHFGTRTYHFPWYKQLLQLGSIQDWLVHVGLAEGFFRLTLPCKRCIFLSCYFFLFQFLFGISVSLPFCFSLFLCFSAALLMSAFPHFFNASFSASPLSVLCFSRFFASQAYTNPKNHHINKPQTGFK